MSEDNAKGGEYEIKMNCDACGLECCGCSFGDDYCCSESGLDSESINNGFVNYEEKEASRALAVLTCVGDILPEDGMAILVIRKSYPMFRSASIDAVRAECLNIYEDWKVRAKWVLRNLDGQISLSVDVLRCPSAGEYLCLKAHFIDDDWNLRNWIISFRPINRSFDDGCLDGAILKCLIDFNIGHKISNITLENCSFVDEGIDDIKDFVQQKRKLPLGGQLFRLYCCVDVFKLMVNDAFEEISKTMVKVDEFMNFGKPRYTWNLAHKMLKEALEFEAKGEWNKEEYENYEKCSADEWKKVEGVCKLLESFYNAAKAIFEAKQPTANIYLHRLYEVHTSLAQASVGSDSFLSPLAKKMLEKLDKYLKHMFLVLAMAKVMDPRCKMKYLDASLAKHGGNDGHLDPSTVKMMTEDGGNDHRLDPSAVLTSIQSLYNDYLTHFSQRRNPIIDSSSLSTGEGTSIEVSDDNSGLLQNYQQFFEEPNTNPLKSELELYLENEVLPWSQDFDTLNWWNAESPKYPVLARMARDILAIPVSVVTSFQAYYTVDREISRRLASLQPELMNALMCTRSWGSPETKSMIRTLMGDDLMDFMETSELAADIVSFYR